jgi:hypothetical protein
MIFNFPSLPAYTDVLALKLAERLQEEAPSFRYRTLSGELVDNLFGEPSVGAPMCVFGSWPDAYYHTSLDTPQTLSPAMLQQMGRLAATYCYFLANCGFEGAIWLAQAVADHAEREISQRASQWREGRGSPAGSKPPAWEDLNYTAQKNLQRLRSIARLVGDRPATLRKLKQPLDDGERFRLGRECRAVLLDNRDVRLGREGLHTLPRLPRGVGRELDAGSRLRARRPSRISSSPFPHPMSRISLPFNGCSNCSIHWSMSRLPYLWWMSIRARRSLLVRRGISSLPSI